MGTPPHPHMAQPYLQGSISSPLKEYQDQLDESDLSHQSFQLKDEDELIMFKSPLRSASSGSFQFPSSQLDSSQIIPTSKNDLAYNTNNEMLQFPPRYDSNGKLIGANSMYYNYPSNEAGSISQQELQDHYQSLYPTLIHSPMLIDEDIPLGSGLPQTFSTTTLSSIDSIPQTFLYSNRMTSSQSDNSLTASLNPTVTPRRKPQRRESVNSNNTQQQQTPSQSIKRTPSSRVVKSHRRTRSRLSVDATGISLLTLQPSTSSTSIRSPQPATGTNPFYTPSVYNSPLRGSPIMTPQLGTPNVKKRDQFSSISPMMLLNQKVQSANTTPQEELPPDVFAEAADMTLKLASRYAYSDMTSQLSRLQRAKQSPAEFYAPFEVSDNFLVDPINTEINEATTNSTENSIKSFSTTSSTPTLTQKDRSHLTKSQSSVSVAALSNTDSKLIPPEITKYDILSPKRHPKQSRSLKKSQSTTDVTSMGEEDIFSGKKSKKSHACPLCSAVFQRPEHVKRHMRSHSSEKPFICEEPDCGKRFNRGDNMKAHLRKIHHRTDV